MSIWSDASTLTDRFTQTLELLSIRTLGRTYQGFSKATKRLAPTLLRLIENHWPTLVKIVSDKYWKTNGWVVFAVDSTKIDLPRSEANEKAYGTTGKNNSGPQSVTCMIEHSSTGLPWCWKIGRSSSSERHMLRQMIYKLPATSLLIADAGFVGFNLWKKLNDAGQSFLIRVGANMRFLKLEDGEVRTHGELVYLWPKNAEREKITPLILRLYYVRDGKDVMCLVTNVLNENKLNDEQVATFYQMRWGIELWFRTMKQTLKKQAMRSQAPVQAALELRWSILGVAMLGLITAKTQIERGIDPLNLSAAQAVRVIRKLMRWPDKRVSPHRLEWNLVKAVMDNYVRGSDKTARHNARKKKHRTPGLPKIVRASEAQILLAQELIAA